MAIKKSALYASLWASCDALRGGMDVSLPLADIERNDYNLNLPHYIGTWRINIAQQLKCAAHLQTMGFSHPL